MKKTVRSPGSATIINAIATGFGSAFGIGLDIECEAQTIPDSIECANDVGADTGLMELCVQKVFNHYDVNSDDFGISLKTKSTLPMASGLSSSSASSNAIVKVVSEMVAEEFDVEPLSDLEVVNMAIDASLDAGVTITGSFDDATASFFGGVVVTDNKNREFTLVETAFDFACKREYFKALNLNGLIYSSALGFNTAIAIDALEEGALASGLSGTGSSFVAVVDDSSIDDVRDSWMKYDGRVIETRTDNDGCRLL